MASDRELRDELEKLQAELKRLRTAGESVTFAAVRERIAKLEQSKADQLDKLRQAQAKLTALDEQLESARAALAPRENEKRLLEGEERQLVAQTVRALTPGVSRGGCLQVPLVLIAMVARSLW